MRELLLSRTWSVHMDETHAILVGSKNGRRSGDGGEVEVRASLSCLPQQLWEGPRLKPKHHTSDPKTNRKAPRDGKLRSRTQEIQ